MWARSATLVLCASLMCGCSGGSNNDDLRALVKTLTQTQAGCAIDEFSSDGYTIGEQKELKSSSYQISAATKVKVLATIAKCKSENPAP